LSDAVAFYAHKLMAYKDEYEVARLHASPEFRKKLEAQFEGKYKLEFNLAPPIISPKDKVTGKPQKIQLGGWMLTAFGLMAKFKFLRGTAFDIFGKSAERKMERRFIEDYFNTVNELLETVSEENYELAVAIARIPEDIRGYGHIKEEHAEKAEAKWGSLLDSWRSGKSKPPLSAIEVEHVSS
jgi:indolepyruvate ferredoxin oxidoreductase